MKNLVSFFAKNNEGIQLVGIGITDEIIEHLKKSHGILQEADRIDQPVDLVLLYAPTLNELMKLVTKTVPKEKLEVKII